MATSVATWRIEVHRGRETGVDGAIYSESPMRPVPGNYGVDTRTPRARPGLVVDGKTGVIGWIGQARGAFLSRHLRPRCSNGSSS